MPRLSLLQGSEIWHTYRGCHLMATDTAAILGKDHYKSALDVYKEKMDPKPSIMTDAMQRGQDLEPIARIQANEMLSTEFVPCVFESDKYPFMAASLDGLSPCGKMVLEIKCLGIKNHKEACEGLIKQEHWIQMQKQLCVTEADTAYYFCYHPDFSNFMGMVQRNEEFIKEIVATESKFWSDYQIVQPPEKPWELKKC